MAKRCWDSSGAKYADFWDARAVLETLQKLPLDWHSVQAVRDRCIVVLRLLHLCRSIDLARALRSQSKLADKQYWLLKRKGAKRPGWEALLSLPIPSVSPVHLLNKYVALTSSQGKAGGPVFLAVTPPFAPLTSNSIGRITKNILLHMGIPVTIFGAHSTRGAAVKMYKSLGLTSEVVCELGCWKNAEAFSKHYLRVGAVETANTIVTNFFLAQSPILEKCGERGVQ